MPDVSSATAKILLVDDELNVIRSLCRALNNYPYQLFTAEDGDQALDVLENQEIDVVITDSRMPGMDGPTLLSEVQSRWPESMRIMLTGYSDMSATIKAINDGNICRYISKPWNNFELYLTIEQALAFRRLEKDRQRLHELTQQQNEALQLANATLESRVQERTRELRETADLLQVANQHLHRSYVTATEVFSSLINQRFPKDRQANKQVIELVRAYCESQDLPQEFADDLSIAAALYNIGKLPWDDAMIAALPDRMDRPQRERYRGYPQAGESLLMALEPAQEASRIIRHHQERWDGAGFPDALSADEIPLGARILKIAVDYVELQMGMILARKVTAEEVLGVMPKYAGRLYDPAVCSQFIEVAEKLRKSAGSTENGVQILKTAELQAGMIVEHDLHSGSGTLLLKRGTPLTDKLIEKLRVFEQNEDAVYELHVSQPEESEDD